MKKHRDRIPTPGQVGNDLVNIDRAIRGGETVKPLLDEYRWAYAASHQATAGDSVKVRASSPDPTGNVAASKEAPRKRVAEGARKVGEALSLIRSARDDFAGALKYLSPERYDPQGRFPPVATKAEVQASREAQAKRMDRGEGFGEA